MKRYVWLLLGVGLPAGAAFRFTSLPVASFVAEIVVVFAVTCLVASFPMSRDYWSTLSVPQRVLIAGLFVFVLAGHFAQKGAKSFPFTRWKMYSYPPRGEMVECYRVYGAERSGQSVRLEVASMLPSLRYHRFGNFLNQVAHRMGESGFRRNEFAVESLDWDDFDRMLRVIGEKHNRAYPERQIVEVMLVRESLPLAWEPGLLNRERKELRRLAVVAGAMRIDEAKEPGV